MQGVNFGGKHSYYAWGLYLQEPPVISPPKIKSKYVDVLGAHGSLDLTEKLTGQVMYEMREMTCKFIMAGERDKWEARRSEILNYLHGSIMEVTVDSDQDFFWTGRAEVKDWKPGQTIAELTIKVKVCPFRASRLDGRQVL